MISLQDYNILFQDAEFNDLKQQLATANYSKIIVLVDQHTAQDCLPILANALQLFPFETITVSAGEQHKNIATCQQIWQALLTVKTDRKAVLINLGGGVIGDMGGFCASTFKRGFDFIQIPTTLLAQVDASIGGKLGIDFGLVKNSIGLFKNPKNVYCHPDFFKTLPQAELYSGFAEIIKHALITDVDYWQQLQALDKLEQMDWNPIIEQSLHIKKSIVEQDPFEKNVRKSLNFGHTIGHAIESLSWENSQPLLHGEAVALGMIMEAFLSHQLTGLSVEELDQISQFILQLYPKYDLKQLNQTAILGLIEQDKKNEQGQICFTLLKQIGQFKINVHASQDQIIAALDYYTKLADNNNHGR